MSDYASSDDQYGWLTRTNDRMIFWWSPQLIPFMDDVLWWHAVIFPDIQWLIDWRTKCMMMDNIHDIYGSLYDISVNWYIMTHTYMIYSHIAISWWWMTPNMMGCSARDHIGSSPKVDATGSWWMMDAGVIMGLLYWDCWIVTPHVDIPVD